MINILFPSSSVRKFHQILGFLVPSADDPFESIELDVYPGSLTQHHGIYGENIVVHTKAEGQLIYDPALEACIIPDASERYPQRVRLENVNFPVACEYGVATSEAIADYLVIPDYITYKRAIRRTGSGYLYRSWGYYVTDPTALDHFFEYEFTEVSRNAQEIHFSLRSRSWQTYYAPRIDYSSLGMAAFEASTTHLSEWSISSYTTQIRTSNSNIVFMSPSNLKGYVQGLCDSRYVAVMKLQHTPKHDGTMAAEAVESMDFVHTNMISFFLDLRDVSSLIPKLSNLKKLKNLKGVKTLSNEYLSIKYGVLPTISDLEEIVSALHRLQPYLDKNGFQVGTAGFHESLSAPFMTSDMTQRIKVAISNEERGLLAVSDGLEKIGMMPNLKTIWDLVPYSFALDWFIDVGGLLESVDSRMRIATLDVKYVTLSKKFERSYNFTADPTSLFQGSVQWVHYHRWVSALAPVPPLSFQAPLALSKHWIEASALLIQRAKFK